MKVLLIEDDPKVASFIKRGLEEQTYEVEQAYDGMFGIKRAQLGTTVAEELQLLPVTSNLV